MGFNEALRCLLQTEGITKEHIAACTGRSVFSVIAWLDGKSEPKIGSVLRIKRAYPSFNSLLDKVAA